MFNLEDIIKIILIVIAFLFIVILIVKRFLYFHPSYEFMNHETEFEDIMEGNVHAWFIHGDTSKVVLFCHGNAGNISHRQDKIISLNNIGFSVLIFDYTGFGHSKGVPTEEKCYHNACMFADILINKYGRDNIVVYGESLGAAVGAHVVLKYRLPILIIESGLPGIKYYLKSRYRFLSFLGFLFNDFNTVDYLNGYHGRLLVLHCRNDEIISWDNVEKIRNIAEKVIEMNGGHNTPQIPWEEVKKFVERNL